MTAVPFADARYNKRPSVAVPGHRAVAGIERVFGTLTSEAQRRASPPTIAIDAYPGVDLARLKATLAVALPDFDCIDVEAEAALDLPALDALFARNLTDDRVFGVLSHHQPEELFDPGRLDALRRRAADRARPTVLVGFGAALAAPDADVTVLADMPRWEIQQRMRRGQPNWRCANGGEDVLRKYKRGFFVEWRIADRHKQALFDRIDFLLDTTDPDTPKLVSGDGFRAGLNAAVARPFRLVPYFDPGIWGGQWMKRVCGLDPESPNFAWSFDCVPEENSLLLSFDGATVEIPAIDLVFRHPVELLGDRTHARFGREFPIRFDLLDTMGGGNLSLQVHPLTEYIQDRFGMPYTQDESYYLLDTGKDPCVYLGVRTGTDPAAMMTALEQAQVGGAPFPDERFINRLPVKKHDHVLIPAGTVHCSGRNTMVLEISATPYIFTFKLWDWGRVGLDGLPRPVHLEHGRQAIQWDRDTDWVDANLVHQVEPLASGHGWTEERTGLHARQFIEARRHWFTEPVPHDTRGTVNVLNLIEGPEAVVTSPEGAFEPFVVHYAETFIVPAAVGPYRIAPTPASANQTLGTIKAFVRGTEG